MDYLKPTTEGYYWYRPGTNWDDEWDIVKVQIYSDGKFPKSKTKLMFQIFGWQNLDEVKKDKGIWGRKVANLRNNNEGGKQ